MRPRRTIDPSQIPAYKYRILPVGRFPALQSEYDTARNNSQLGRHKMYLDQIAQLKRLARQFDLEVSAGSDFHRDAPYSAPLGVESAPFEGLRCVWERWAVPR